MVTKKIELTKAEKILIVMAELSRGKKKNTRFEDLVVALFKEYPDEFHLKGYSKYPDSESVNNALYHNLKKEGVMVYGNKVFSLTDYGIRKARALKKIISGKKVKKTSRLPKHIENDLMRISKLEGMKLFISGREREIVDTDFYNYLGISVRSENAEIVGKIKAIKIIMEELEGDKVSQEKFIKIIKYHDFLFNKFKDLSKYHLENK